MNSYENNGILGYEGSKRKRVKDALLGDVVPHNGVDTFSDEERGRMSDAMDSLSSYMSGEQQRLSAPIDAKQREREYIGSAIDYIVPEDNELRRRRNFVMSQNTVRDVATELYDGSVKSIFDKERADTEAKAFDEYKKYASVPGADALTSLGAMRRVADPEKVIERTMSKVDGEKLSDVASAYANYARLSPQAYRRDLLEPELKQRMMDEYIEEAKPGNSAAYIARSAWDNSLIGKATALGLNGYSQTNAQDRIERAGLQAYGANRAENLAAGIGSLIVDIPAFGAIGSMSAKAVSKALPAMTKSVGKAILKKYAPAGMLGKEAERIARGAIVSGMSGKIVSSAATQGLTLGGYDAANTLTDDLLMNDGIDVSGVVDSFAHGFRTGALLGVVGTPLKIASRGLTGGKKIAASAGVLSAESAVFTASGNFDKLSSGADIEPVDLLCDFGESVATLAAMRLVHWRPKRAAEKLDARGRLLPELRLTKAEEKDISLTGVNPEMFIKEVESSLNRGERLSPVESERVKEKYLKLLGSDKLATSTRLKLMYIIEDKLADTSPAAVDYKVENGEGEGVKVSLFDAYGRRIKSEFFDNKEELTTFLLRERSGVRRNKIARLEEMLLGKFDTENFFRQAGRLSSETGVGVDEISEAVYKKLNNSPLTSREQNIVKELAERTTYGDTEVGLMLSEIRKGLERDFNLREGSLLAAVNRESYRCSPDENRALDRYMEIMEGEAKALEQGTSAEQRARLAEMRSRSPYEGMGNEAIKAAELGDYRKMAAASYNEYLNKGSMPDLTEGDGDGYIKVPEKWNKPYAWSYLGVRNTAEDMKRYKARADEIANRLGFKLQYLFDENSLPKSGDKTDYNNRVRALGWVDNSTGKIYINLPNISNMEQLEKTIVHELVGHGGLNRLFGEYIFDFYDDVYALADDNVRNEIYKMKQRYGFDGGYLAVEEYLAHLAEKTNPTPKERSILGRFKDYVKNILARNNLFVDANGNARFSEEDFRTMLEKHHEAMQNRVSPHNYRARVFPFFLSARHRRNYYDSEQYKRFFERRLETEDILGDTPDFLFSDKKKLFGDAIEEYKRRHDKDSYRFIGEKGAQNLSHGAYAECYELLKKAKALEAQNADRITIWKKTGWERGADGEWRMEMPDHKLRVRDCLYYRLDTFVPELAERYRTLVEKKPWTRTTEEMKELFGILKDADSLTNHLKVKDVIVDNSLFDAYPELRNLPVKFVDRLDELCNYDARTQTLYIQKGALLSPDRLQKEIVKPVQQMIQHYEGFAQTVSMYKADSEKLFREEYEQAIRDFNIIEKMMEEDRNHSLRSQLVNEFKEKYGRTPFDFKYDFPTIEEYIINRIYGDKYAFSGNAEVDNVYRRNKMSRTEQRKHPMIETETPERSKLVPLKRVSELKKYLKGPLDIIYSNLRDMYNIKPFKKGKQRAGDEESYFDEVDKYEDFVEQKILGIPYSDEAAKDDRSGASRSTDGFSYFEKYGMKTPYLVKPKSDKSNYKIVGRGYDDELDRLAEENESGKQLDERLRSRYNVTGDKYNEANWENEIIDLTDEDLRYIDEYIEQRERKNKRLAEPDQKEVDEIARIVNKHFDKEGNLLDLPDDGTDWDAINERLEQTEAVRELKKYAERLQREEAQPARDEEIDEYDGYIEDIYDKDGNLVIPGLEFDDKAEAAEFTEAYHRILDEIDEAGREKRRAAREEMELHKSIQELLNDKEVQEIQRLLDRYYDKDGNEIELPDDDIDWVALSEKLESKKGIKKLLKYLEKYGKEIFGDDK